MMKKYVHVVFVFLLGLVACLNVNGQAKIHVFKFNDGSVIRGMSSNGKWAVAFGPSAADGGKYLYPKLINVTTDEVKELLTDEELAVVSECDATGVSDDGSIIAGSHNGIPAVYINNKWAELPIPEDAGFGSGLLAALTPDGRYAVGRLYLAYEETPILYDLSEDGEVIATPGLPTTDISGVYEGQQRFCDISDDGRYIIGCTSFSYQNNVTYFVYDRNSSSYVTLGFDLSEGKYVPKVEGLHHIESAQICHGGPWVGGTAYMVKSIEGTEWPMEYRTPYRYNIETQVFELFDDSESNNMECFAIGSDGTLYAGNPPATPARTLYMRQGNYWYDMTQVLKQCYGIDYYAFTGFESSGSPIDVSADNTVLSCIAYVSEESYVLTLPETFSSAARKVNLLADYTVTPGQSTSFARMPSTFSIKFNRNVQVLGSSTSASFINNNTGSTLKTSLNVKANEATPSVVDISFRPTSLEEGVSYSLVVPAGTICVAGDEARTNQEIKVTYTGRRSGPLTMTAVSPEEGSKVSLFNFTTNPVVATFDADVALSENAKANLYIEGQDEPLCDLNILKADKRILLYPTVTQYLYDGSKYRIEIEAGSVTDVTGQDGNEFTTIHYDGAYVREVVTNDTIMYQEDFDGGLDNVMLYDGDRLNPIQEMKDWTFTDNCAWMWVNDDDNYENMAAASHSMYDSAGQSDDWLVTPQCYIPDDKCVLSFVSQSYKNAKTDRLKVLVWVNEEVVNNLTADLVARIKNEGVVVYDGVENPGKNEEMLAGDWTLRNIPLAQFAGKSVYVAFVNENEGQSAVFIDDVMIVRRQDYVISVSTPTTVANKESIKITGNVVVKGDKTYNSTKLTLLDSSLTVVDVFNSTTTLGQDGNLPFEFAKELPLTLGKENLCYVAADLDGQLDTLKVSVKDLAFEPVKRLSIEEFTGMDCPNCPLGILAMEKLEQTYPGLIVPMAYHTYTGDIYDSGLASYTQDVLGLTNAPSALINRTSINSPMTRYYSNSTYDYTFYSKEHDCWLDVAETEFATLGEANLDLTATYNADTKEVNTLISFTYALDKESQNVNLLVGVTEDKLNGYQANNLYTIEDEDLGPWGAGGSLASGTVLYTFNDVVRQLVGNTNWGTGGLVPSTVIAGKEYTAQVAFQLSGYVKDANNCNVVCIMIDANTGKTINAARTKLENISSVADRQSGSLIEIAAVGHSLIISGARQAQAEVYAPNGTKLAGGSIQGLTRINIEGYEGLAIVKVTSGADTTVKKVMLK